MPSSNEISFDRLLALIGRSSSGPWYPAEFARDAGVDRKALERLLDAIRLAGLIEFADWEAGRGQGLQLTEAGVRVLTSPRLLARLAQGELPRKGQVLSAPSDLGEIGSTYSKGETIRLAILNPFKPQLTIALIAINVVVFLVGQAIALRGADPGIVRFGDSRPLVYTGAVSGDLLLRGQWWRLLTCCFVHIGAMHLFMNMFALWSLGPIQERLWGRARFLCIYLVAGFAGSCAGMTRHPEHLLAGASGAIWGLMSAMMVWVLMNRSHLPRELYSQWLQQLGTSLVLNLMISFMPGISMEAHLGGGIAGGVVAALLQIHRFASRPVRLACLAGVLAVPIISLSFVFGAQSVNARWAKVIKSAKPDAEQRRPVDDVDVR